MHFVAFILNNAASRSLSCDLGSLLKRNFNSVQLLCLEIHFMQDADLCKKRSANEFELLTQEML